MCRFDAKDNLIASDITVASSAFGDSSADLAMDSAGNAVVTYLERTDWPDIQDVKAKRVFTNGLTGGWVTIQSGLKNAGAVPSVAVQPTGGSYVVTYESLSPQGNSFWVTKVNAANTVNALKGTYAGSWAKVSMDGYGRFLVTYDRQIGANDWDAFARRGLLTDFASEGSLSNSGTHDQFETANASSANGTSVAVWVDTVSASDHNILAQLFDKQGGKVGPVIQVDASLADSYTPAVAMDSKGNFAVTWTDTTAGSNGDIKARYYAASGQPITGIFTVAGSAKEEYAPDVAASNGSFVIAYQLENSAQNNDIRVHRYLVSGLSILDKGDFGVATSAKSEWSPSVAMSPDGRFDIAYNYSFSVTDTDIYLCRYSSAGSLIGGAQVIAGSSLNETAPDVAMDNNGNAVVAYLKDNSITGQHDVVARRVSSVGAAGGEITVASAPTSQYEPTVALSPSGGQFVVSYHNISQVKLVEVSSKDQIAVVQGPVAGYDPSVSIDGFGRYTVTYTKIVNGKSQVFRRRDLLSFN
jgi:hypothetical protein